MALKIEFSAQFKDAQLVQSAIKSLQKELVELGKTGANASTQLNKSMQGVAESINKINQLSKGTGGLKDLNNQLDALVKMGSGIQGFARNFDAIGRAVNANLGNATTMMVKQFKNNIASMQSEIDTQTKAFTRLQDRMGFLKDKYGEDSPIYQRAAAIQASRATGIAYGEQALSDAQMELQMSRPRGFLGGMNLRQVNSLAAAPYAISEGAFAFSTMGIRSEIAQRKLALQAGYEAAQGDPTLAITKGMGIGIESGGMGVAKASTYGAEYFKEGLKYAGIITAGIVGTVLTGGAALPMLAATGTIAATTGFRGFGEINADAIRRQRELDKALYSPLFEPAYKAYHAAHGKFYDFYKMSGDTMANRTIASIMSSGAGLSMEQLEPGLAAAMHYGYLPTSASYDVMASGRDYGLTTYGVGQMARLSRAAVFDSDFYSRPSLMRQLSGFIGGSGVGRDIAARRALTNAMFQNLEGMGGQVDISSAGAMIQSASRSLAGTGIYTSQFGGMNVEGAEVAVSAAQNIQNQMQTPMNYANMMFDMKLISLGVTDVGVRQMLIALISRIGVTSKVIQAIQSIQRVTRGQAMSDDEIMSALGSAGQAASRARQKAFGVNTPQARAAAAAGFDIGGFYSGGVRGAVNQTFLAETAVLENIGQKPVSPAGDFSLGLTGEDIISGGRGKMTAKQLEAFDEFGEEYSKKLHTTIYNSISQALIDTGNEIARGIKDLSTKDTHTDAFTGRETKYRKKI